MKTIPIVDTFSQIVRVQLGEQSCRINLRQNSTGFYMDLFVNEQAIVLGAICVNRTRVVRDAYLGFKGDLAMVDMDGNADPSSPGLGTRFLLCYFDQSELPAGA
jgi:hypothetical protein